MPRPDRPDAPEPEWEPCAPGAVAQLGKKLRGRKSRRAVLRATGGAVAAALCAGGLWLALGRAPRAAHDSGGMTCAEVARRAPEYVAGTVPEALRARIAEHLAQCPRCAALFAPARQQPS